ncbi:MAG: hypothetical protein ACI9GM_000591 [Salibacteraceae bacterium]|jgi:hypothetical protein
MVIAQKVSGDSTAQFEGKKQQISHEDLEEYHSPKKATILSACLPGAGQIYNKKFWKLPIIWGGIGTAIYFGEVNKKQYHFYRNEYILELGYPLTQSQFHEVATLASIRDTKNSYRTWMETSYVVAGVIYILQIVDANVDAQLMTFDVSDDLSLNVIPEGIPNQLRPTPTMGFTFALKFK